MTECLRSEKIFQQLPFSHFKLMFFFPKSVTKKPGLHQHSYSIGYNIAKLSEELYSKINWKITLFVRKKQIQNNGCQSSVAIVMSMLKYKTARRQDDFLKCSQILLGKVIKSIGHSLKSFEVNQPFSKGELKSHPRLSTVKSCLVVCPVQCKRLQSMSLCPEIKLLAERKAG